MDQAANEATGWSYFREKILPGLFLLLTSLALAGGWGIYRDVQRVINVIDSHERQIAEMKADIVSIRSNAVTHAEFIESFKSLQQQLEIALLRAGIRTGSVRLTDLR